ncbi:Ig-like domain-containing protein [Microbacterium aurantiacum]|uniref:Ig-like domain-containing protein n=1 Tax=Microbacterium aurantiacum TaxID=162393 RepID=UPI001FE9B59E|nr:Ig-like domain-containing protein [Microbacterium aurantiacum]
MTAGVIALTTMAFTYEGFPTTKVDLNDGGVWITKTSSLLVGHFNHESTVLDGGVRTTGENFDILQDATSVLVVDEGSSTLSSVDPARVSLGDSTGIPSGAKVALGNRSVAILDRESGNLWVVPIKGVAAFEFQAAEPVAELGDDADVTVAYDGTVFGLSSERAEVVTVPVDNEGQPLESSTAGLGELDASVAPTITAVGRTPIVLDPAAGLVMAPGGFRTEIGDADGAVLQQASAETDAVAIATTSHLLRVPLDGAEPQAVSSEAQGAPAAPVALRGCTYAAWAGSARFMRECPGEPNDVNETIPDAADSASLVFRVNRDVIILNDAVGGAAWLPNESLQRVDNWNDLTPPEGETENQEESSQETVETTLPERTEINTPPVAADDEFGVRPGGTTLLPVLDNDNDPDGDVLVAALAETQPSLGEVQQIHNGGSLQIQVAKDASGSASFVYEVDDGRGGKDTAAVAVSVHDWSVNAAPTPKRPTSIAVESGGTVSYNILPDWIDPDGDDVYLRNVIAAPGDEVDFSTDGQISYHAIASAQGIKEIEVVVSDSQGEVSHGSLRLDVRPAGSTLPKTNADHVVTRVGELISVAPLANDTSSGREPLRLSRVDEVAGAAIVADFPNKVFTFRADQPGVYYVQYLVSAGPNGVPGLVRVDVLEKAQTELPPVAVRDVALLPTSGEILLGVLGNDSDPAGGILVLQSVTVPPQSGISVSVLNHETLRISDQGALSGEVRITYRISNGTKTAEGDVIVIPIPAPDKLEAPVANDDQVTVRAGDVVTIPVLDNDTHPSGDILRLDPELVEPLVDPAEGEAFVSQNAVRFRAGTEPGTAYVTYQAVDSIGQKDAAFVNIQILAVDEEANAAPRPRDVTVRTLSGSSTQIAIPLDGIDADGDSVELLENASAPAKGQINEVGSNYLVYEAFDGVTGVDTFTYRVRDRLGKEGTATIRIGIAPSESMNQAPYAVKDAVVVRPGRSVAVPVTANDSDPEGDEIILVEKGIELPDVDGLSAKVSGDRVIVDVPDRETETSLQYTIRDARGATSTAVLQITVDEDVPLLTPIARDDRVRSADVVDGLQVDVAVLENDEDPDGTIDDLQLKVEQGGRLLEDGTVRVTIGEERQLIRYTLTDLDERTASAFIFVPALRELRPAPSSTEPVTVKSGERVELPLAEYVTVAGGGDVIITEAEKVSAVNADGSSLIKDERTLQYTSRAGYFGKDALTFEVTDGAGPDDPEGRKATLTIPIIVLPPENQQPVFVNGQVSVAPGEEPATLDLAALTTDPDPEDAEKIRFAVVEQPGGGISARVDGSRLLVEASTNTRKGAAATVTVRIDDGTTEPVTGTVAVTVSASTRNLATANTDTVDEADQGKAIRVRVLDNDVNPFPDTPLEVLSATPETGDGTATVIGNEVEVKPGADFVGRMVVRYRIQDATDDPDREVDGTIVLTVQGEPDAPGSPVVSSVQDRTVVLSWSPPANNGAEITQYTVRSVQGSSYTKTCAATTCTLDGLTNNVEYTFQVTATNRVGEGPESPVSAIARPDARPDTPAPPTLVFGDKSLKVSWATPTTPGSPVESYTLQISPAPPSGIAEKANVVGNSLTWEGLENGASYQVRVQAHNRAPEPSSFSNWSANEIPAGPPAAPGTPTARSAPSVGSQAQMEVSWTPGSENGDPVSTYELNVIRGGTVVRTVAVAGGQHSQNVTVDTSTADYTFSVRARNKAGWGDPSGQSTPQRAFGSPGAPTITATREGDNWVEVDYSTANTNGANTEELRYEYSLNGSGWSRNWDGKRLSAANNGEYTVRVRAYSVVGGQESQPGPESAPSAVLRPYGLPGQPGASASVSNKSINWSWSAPGPNGRAIVKMEVQFDGGGWTEVAHNSGTTGNYGPGETHTMTVRATDAQGQTSTNSASATTASPTAQTVQGAVARDHSSPCEFDVCYFLWVSVSNFPAGTYTVRCHSDAGRIGTYDHTYTIPENGTAGADGWDTRGWGCFSGGTSGNDYNLRLEILGWGWAQPTNWG